MQVTIHQVDDFPITGDGRAPAWASAEWLALTRVGAGPADYATRAKVLWSRTGIYALVDCEDRKLNCTLTEDGADLYLEDVAEMFLWPYEPQRVYFEYELSPLGYELALMVTNPLGRSQPWLPWHYDAQRQVQRAVSVRGGKATPGATISGWTAEWFIPFALMGGMVDVPPAERSRWRGNIYRIDYDTGEPSHWALSPATGADFHNIDGFATFVFA